MELRDFTERGTDLRADLKFWHITFGMIIFLSVWLRIVTRLFSATPEITPPPPKMQMLVAKVVKLGLYGIMIALPLIGWVMQSAKGQAIPLLGFEFPALMGIDKDFGRQLKGIHSIVGKIGYALIALHVVGALHHHFIVKDNTLKRMLRG